MIRMRVHVNEVQILSTIDEEKSVYDLKLKIETDCTSIYPEEAPLVCKAIQDSGGFLLPDHLILKDILSDDDNVYVTPVDGI